MRGKVFLDTAFAIALALETDAFHEEALVLADEIEAEEIHLITTRAIMLEIGNALSRSDHRKTAIEILESLELDNKVTIVPLTEELYKAAYKLYSSRADKEWGMTDCISFTVMQQFNLTDSLTTDRHFRQAGFNPLMR